MLLKLKMAQKAIREHLNLYNSPDANDEQMSPTEVRAAMNAIDAIEEFIDTTRL